MKKSKPHAPYARKATFWNKKRIESKFTLKEISQLIHKHESITGMYFSGQLLPPDSVISELCDLFEVDYNTGNLEFQHAHRDWKADHHAPLAYSAKEKVASVDTTSQSADSVATIESVAVTVKAEDILSKLYGVLSCADFLRVYDSFINGQSVNNLAELIYGKFDYATYNKILETVVSFAASDDKWSV